MKARRPRSFIAALPAVRLSGASSLADHIVVDGADVQHGLLHVGLKRVVPEALKPRKIAIGSGAPAAITSDTRCE